MPKVYIATDHAGFELKNKLVPYIGTLGYEVEDLGAFGLNEDDDYPDLITPCAQAVLGSQAVGIILGGSGQGEAMVANRVPGIRAAVFYGGPLELVRLAREHNDANMLSLAARFVSEKEAYEAVSVFLSTEFSGESRHVRRIHKF